MVGFAGLKEVKKTYDDFFSFLVSGLLSATSSRNEMKPIVFLL